MNNIKLVLYISFLVIFNGRSNIIQQCKKNEKWIARTRCQIECSSNREKSNHIHEAQVKGITRQKAQVPPFLHSVVQKIALQSIHDSSPKGLTS